MVDFLLEPHGQCFRALLQPQHAEHHVYSRLPGGEVNCSSFLLCSKQRELKLVAFIKMKIKTFFLIPQLGDYEVSLAFWTPFFNVTVEKNITIGGSLRKVVLKQLTTDWSDGKVGYFRLEWETLTSDSCICLDLGNGEKVRAFHWNWSAQ